MTSPVNKTSGDPFIPVVKYCAKGNKSDKEIFQMVLNSNTPKNTNRKSFLKLQQNQMELTQRSLASTVLFNIGVCVCVCVCVLFFSFPAPRLSFYNTNIECLFFFPLFFYKSFMAYKNTFPGAKPPLESAVLCPN